MEIVEVRFVAGKPVEVQRAGHTWKVVAEPLRWFERSAWWREQWFAREQIRVDVPVWRVQVRLGGRHGDIVTWDLEQDRGGAWRLRPETNQA